MQCTLLLKFESDFSSFEQHVGRSPLLLMCLYGKDGDGGQARATASKDKSWLQPGRMAEQPTELGGQSVSVADVVSLQVWALQDAVDYVGIPGTPNALSIADIQSNRTRL